MLEWQKVLPREVIRGKELTAAMAGIGMLFGFVLPDFERIIEDVIFYASVEGMSGDGRTLRVLISWLDWYGKLVNVDRMTSIAEYHPTKKVKAFWAGVGIWKGWGRMARVYDGERIDKASDFTVNRYGEDERFKDGPVRFSKSFFRKIEKDVFDVDGTARLNIFIRNRIEMGPVVQADMRALLELHPEIDAQTLAERTYGTLEVATDIKKG